jgi:hypothetical protein
MKRLGLVCLAALFWLATVAQAEDPAPPPLGVGDSLPELTLEDQHGEQRVVDVSTRLILFSRDMDGGDVLKTGLADLPEEALPSAGAVYVSDISGMPSLIARMFALPRMRGRPYAMLLDRTGETTALLPDVPGRATLIHLDALQITALEHFETAEEVRARVLELAPAPAARP